MLLRLKPCDNLHWRALSLYKFSNVEYYQIAQTVQQPETLERELKPLDSIKDHNSKYLLMLDVEPPASHKGIK